MYRSVWSICQYHEWIDCISYVLTYYSGGGGGLTDTARGMLYSATICTMKSVWMILASATSTVVKKLVCLVTFTSIRLIHVFIMLVQFIDFKAAIYTSVTYLIRQSINIIWRIICRLAVDLLGCVVYLYTDIKLLVLAPFNQVKQKEPPLPPDAVAISDDEDSDDDSLIDFGVADSIDGCVDVDEDIPPPPPPNPQICRSRKKYPPAVWHRGRGGRGGRLRPRIQAG